MRTARVLCAIRVAHETKMPVHIFHLTIRGEENWGTIGKYLEKIEAARARGLDVTANPYPYTAMQHGWSAFFPVWAREHGPQKFAAMLKDPAIRAKIKADKCLITRQCVDSPDVNEPNNQNQEPWVLVDAQYTKVTYSHQQGGTEAEALYQPKFG